MATFSDNFSKHASIYAKFRPSYPYELYNYLHSLTTQHTLAWDCGTGNGQSAIHLADFYDQVFATDPSESQLKNAFAHDRVMYKVEKAEETSLADQSVNLITVAQAVHWFDFDVFYQQVNRVLKPDGIIAVWAYGVPNITPEIDKITQHFHDHVVGEFWQKENKLIQRGYLTIPFPFKEIEPPEFQINTKFKLQDLLGHLLSWSATQRYIKQHQVDPLLAVQQEFEKHWKNPAEAKSVSWKIMLRVGKVPK